MNTRKLRKMILTLCSALLLVSLSVGITLAYLTDDDSVTNTFTVGKVGISLDETDVWDVEDIGTIYGTDENGEELAVSSDMVGSVKPDATREDKENDYKLYPGHSYTKDPVIKTDADCDLAFLRVVITFENGKNAMSVPGLVLEDMFYRATTDDNMIWGWNETDENGNRCWNIDSVEVVGENVEYTLTATDFINAGTPDIELFDTMKIPESLTNEDLAKLQGVKMVIKAYAVQADGFVGATTLEKANKAFAAAFPELWGAE